MTFTVALLQMAAAGADQDANLEKGVEFCRRAAGQGADLALFPEMWNVGYASCPPDAVGREAWQALAAPEDGPWVGSFRELARELQMAIAVTYLQRWQPSPRNAVSLIDRHGHLLFTYAKVHTCDFDWERNLTRGDDFCVAPLDTSAGEVLVGAMICYDREFPESARILMLKGAEVILTPNCCTLERHRLRQFATRACENMVGVAMANHAPPMTSGHSVAYDGVAFTGKEDGPDDGSIETLIIEAGPAEGVYLAPFDMERLRDYRRRETWGNAYRRPEIYGPLVSREVQPPFVREDARR